MIDMYKSGKYDVALKFDFTDLPELLKILEKLKNCEESIISGDCKLISFKKNIKDDIYNYIELRKNSIMLELCEEEIEVLHEYFCDCLISKQLPFDDELFTCIYKNKTFTVYPVLIISDDLNYILNTNEYGKRQ